MARQKRPLLKKANIVACHKHRIQIINRASYVATTRTRSRCLTVRSAFQMSRSLASRHKLRARNSLWRECMDLVRRHRKGEEAEVLNGLQRALRESATCPTCERLRRGRVAGNDEVESWARRATERVLSTVSKTAPVQRHRRRAAAMERRGIVHRTRMLYGSVKLNARLTYMYARTPPPAALERVARLGPGYVPATVTLTWRTAVLAVARAEACIRRQLDPYPERADDAWATRRALAAALAAWRPEPDSLVPDERRLLNPKALPDFHVLVPDKGRMSLIAVDRSAYRAKVRALLTAQFGAPVPMPDDGPCGLGKKMLNDIHGLRKLFGRPMYRKFHNVTAYCAVAFALPKIHKIDEEADPEKREKMVEQATKPAPAGATDAEVWPHKARLVVSPRACPWFAVSKLVQPALRAALQRRPKHWVAESVNGTKQWREVFKAKLPPGFKLPDGFVLAKYDATDMFFRCVRSRCCRVLKPLLEKVGIDGLAAALGVPKSDVPDGIVGVILKSVVDMRVYILGPEEADGGVTEVFEDANSCSIGMPTSEDLAEAWALVCEQAVLDAIYGNGQQDEPNPGDHGDGPAAGGAAAHGAAGGAAPPVPRPLLWARRADDVCACVHRDEVDRIECSMNRLCLADTTKPPAPTFKRVRVAWCELHIDVHVCTEGTPCPAACADLPWGCEARGDTVSMLDTRVSIGEDRTVSMRVYRKPCDGPLRAHWETCAPDHMRFMGARSYGTRAATVCTTEAAIADERATVIERAKADHAEPARVARAFDTAVAAARAREHRDACKAAPRVWVCTQAAKDEAVSVVWPAVIHESTVTACTLAAIREPYLLCDVPWSCIRPAPPPPPRGQRKAAAAAPPDPWCPGHAGAWVHKADAPKRPPETRRAYISWPWLGQESAAATRRLLPAAGVSLAQRMPSLARTFAAPRPRPPPTAGPGVYAYRCTTCGKLYVGETVRPCYERHAEHESTCATALATSSVAAHRAIAGHANGEWRVAVGTATQLQGELIEALLLEAVPPSMRLNDGVGEQASADDDGHRAKFVRHVDRIWHGALAGPLHEWWKRLFATGADADRDADDLLYGDGSDDPLNQLAPAAAAVGDEQPAAGAADADQPMLGDAA